MVEVIQQIVVPNGLAQQGGYSVPPYTSIHLHETANPNATMQNERDYLAGHYDNAFYTHLVGFNHETGRAEAWEVAHKNQGAWDLGNYNGNANGYASVEFSHGSARTQEQFNAAYKVYIELARQLANEAGASIELDSPKSVSTAGAGYVVTHRFASLNGFGSSHTDPVAYFESMGVSYDKFKQDLLNGLTYGSNAVVATTSTQQPAPTQNTQTASSSIQSFKNAGGVFTAYKPFRVDEIKQVNGIWQMINVGLAGGNDFNWTYNGVPLDIVDNVTRGNQLATQVGDMVVFNKSYNHGTIDDYDTASNAVGIKYGNYGEIWFDADAFIKL